ncbi:MAG: hypothetical protein KKG47_15025 [Proteobacteria bacterium]|nr:hypothetical protein [Pseudomonadota bacterium]
MKILFNKKTLAMCVASAALLILPLTASALDKLIVNDIGGSPVFTVDDAGTASATKLGIGTATPANTLSVVSELTTATRGLAVTHYSDNPAGAAGQFIKSRGTEATPASVVSGDYTGAFVFRNYTSSGFIGTGFFGAYVNGTVTANSAPTDIFFCNSDTNITNCFGENKVNLVLKSTGEVNLRRLSSTYVGGSAYLCISDNGDIFTSETACP